MFNKILPLALIATLTIGFNTTFAADLSTPDVDDVEYPDDEEPSELEITLGKNLFFDTRLSLNRKQSCASCHNPDLGFSDGMASGTIGRNTPIFTT
jgi:cytochrome c peroxidase